MKDSKYDVLSGLREMKTGYRRCMTGKRGKTDASINNHYIRIFIYT